MTSPATFQPLPPANGVDLAIIGAGSAGFSAAIAAAEQGAKVALVGHGTIGGTCVNIGCVPSKTLIRAADALHQARHASRCAGHVGDVGVFRQQVGVLGLPQVGDQLVLLGD